MASIVLLAQALPSASSGVDWLYQFTNNLTNLTTQNGGALTQLGMTELSLHFVLYARQHGRELADLHHDVPSASSPDSSGRSDEVPAAAHHLLPLGELLGESVSRRELRHQPLLFLHRPGDGCGLRSEFAGLALQLLKTAGDNTACRRSRRRFRSSATSLCRSSLDWLLRILFLINCSAFILYGVTALFGPIFVPLLMTKTFRAKFFHFLDVLISFAMIRAVAAAFIFVWSGFMNAFIQQTFNGNYSMEMWLANLIPCTMVFIAFIINMLFIPSMTQAIFGGAAGLTSGAHASRGRRQLGTQMAAGGAKIMWNFLLRSFLRRALVRSRVMRVCIS